jgi:hypothetical protein
MKLGNSALDRIKILRVFLWVFGIFTLFWWPLSHWFYPDWYHNLLGFESYDYSLVKVIGTIGIVPVLGIFFSARNPVRNRDFILVLITFCILMAATYIFLITTRGFPVREYVNVGLLIFSAVFLTVFFPYVPVGDNSD